LVWGSRNFLCLAERGNQDSFEKKVGEEKKKKKDPYKRKRSKTGAVLKKRL